ncbi:tyrosine protein phosphatase [Allobacillus sp. SKP2-8]|uniref:tyrosine-protein phosphatase n=1 Tax=unclassified Allobacillus TaxID=2628859 RepID=UPI001183C762|nr:CpsB/CapC family capsule biosynthesis tyrosine phosphatase [Allobacillus sp. SKP2-8]TSJ62537.1 tyrosine protein phosphatase [Allobacillus sp. SKP2-8]
MIDLHSHILFGVDDGAQTIEDSVAMAQAAVTEGISVIYATPHHLTTRYENERDIVLPKVDELNAEFNRLGIDLVVKPGQELRIHGDLLGGLQDGTSIPLGDTNYLLIEFPANHVPRYTERVLFDIQSEGYKPIIVHPERNSDLIQKPDKLLDLVQIGALTQVTAASVAGKFGKKIKQFSMQLIESNLTHFVASDAHNTTTRGLCVQEAYAEIEKEFGYGISEMLKENARMVDRNETVIGEPPIAVKKKKKFWVF